MPAVALLAGSAIGLSVPEFAPSLGLIPLALATSVAAGAWVCHRPQLLAAAAGLAFFAGGALLAERRWHEALHPPLLTVFDELAARERADSTRAGRTLPLDDSAFALVEGTLRSDAAAAGAGVSLALDVERLDGRAAAGGASLTVVGALGPSHAAEWRAGRRAKMPATLHRPARYLDPGVPDAPRALAVRGVVLVGTVKSATLVELMASGGRVAETLGEVRAFTRRAIVRHVGGWAPRSAAIVAAIVIGDRAGLDPAVQQRLQEAGTYHVIAISGGNIAILAGVMLGVFRLAGALGRSAMLSAVALLAAYALLVGGGASVDRATLMAGLYLGGRALDLRSDPLNALALVAGVLTAIDPLSVVQPAFVLTCGATFGILLVMPRVVAWRLPAPFAALAAMLAASAAAEALLLPVGAVAFARVTVAGLVLNFAAIPLMAVAQIAGMLAAPLALVSVRLADIAGLAAHLGAAGLVWSADLVRFASWSSVRVAPPNGFVVVAYYLGLAGWWLFPPARHLLRASSLAAAIAAAVWIVAEPWAIVRSRGDGRLHAVFIDVGQGEAVAVRFPRGETMLVDAGGLSAASGFDLGDRVVAPVLRDAGVWRLKIAALTHGDPDHMGGLASVVREFRPRELWEGIPVPGFAPLQALHEVARAHGVGGRSVQAGDTTVVDGVHVVVRHPPPADWERQRVRNDDSLVIELRLGLVSILLTGDVGREAERRFAPALAPAALRIVSIPHHGSPTSSSAEFIAAARPRIAVVSVGRANRFGHPAPDVLARFAAAGVDIFRTDRDGAVTVSTDGREVEVETFTGRREIYMSPPANHEDTTNTKDASK